MERWREAKEMGGRVERWVGGWRERWRDGWIGGWRDVVTKDCR